MEDGPLLQSVSMIRSSSLLSFGEGISESTLLHDAVVRKRRQRHQEGRHRKGLPTQRAVAGIQRLILRQTFCQLDQNAFRIRDEGVRQPEFPSPGGVDVHLYALVLQFLAERWQIADFEAEVIDDAVFAAQLPSAGGRKSEVHAG